MKQIIPLLLIVGILIGASYKFTATNLTEENTKKTVDIIKISPPNLKVYHSVNKYAPEFDIPFKYAFNTVEEETGYKNPLDYTYNHAQTSYADAEGPWQFLLSTAREVSDDPTLTRERLRYDVELNTMLSMKYQRQLKNRYKKWELAYGYYNTGYPKINQYARNIVN